ncbi:hypothetical protein AAKU67_001671 [Oxalobacteraceae bacterium GrIS 2.11]
MSQTPNQESPGLATELEQQLNHVIDESDGQSNVAGRPLFRQTRPLSNYDSIMRSHAALCEAGR